MPRRSPTLVRTLVVLAASALSFSTHTAFASDPDTTALSAHAAVADDVVTGPAPEAGFGAAAAAAGDMDGDGFGDLVVGSFPSGGYHDVRIDGRRDDGSRLGSGVYLYRVETREGAATGRIAVVN